MILELNSTEIHEPPSIRHMSHWYASADLRPYDSLIDSCGTTSVRHSVEVMKSLRPLLNSQNTVTKILNYKLLKLFDELFQLQDNLK